MRSRESNRFAVRARFVFPISSPPIENAVVVCHDGVVTTLAEYGGESHVVDLGDVALLPGLVNAHTHLEFSLLTEPLGSTVGTFAGWIRQVLAYRTERDRAGPDGALSSVLAGLTELQQHGTCLVGEISTNDRVSDPLAWGTLQAGPAGVQFLELLGLSGPRVRQQIDRAVAFLARSRHPSNRWSPGLSPHAPYTAAPRLVEACAALSRKYRIPIAMHVAETREELQLLEQQQGPLRDLLEELGVWYPAAFRPAGRPLDYLHLLSKAERALIIHGNYLGSDERNFLARHRDRLSLVYCPRTHAFFQHDPYPLAQLIDCGVQLALGTDSRASNPDLSLWQEMKFVAEHHPAVAPRKILELGTLSAASALGASDQWGQICPGAPAVLTCVEIGSDRPRDPHELLFRTPESPRQVTAATT